MKTLSTGQYFKLLLDPGDFHSNSSGLLSFNKSETVLWKVAKILLLSTSNKPAQGCNLGPFFGDWSQNETISGIKPPLKDQSRDITAHGCF